MDLQRIKNTAIIYLTRVEIYPGLGIRFYRIETLVAGILLHLVVDFTRSWE